MNFSKALKVILSLTFLFTLGCQPLKGTLNVLNDLTIISIVEKKTPTFPPTPPKKVKVVRNISPGSYSTNITSFSDDEIKLNIKANKTYKVVLNVPEGKHIPKHTGSFTLSGAESGQNWDLKGNIATSTSRSEVVYEREWGCRYTERVKVCRADRQGRVSCYWETRFRRGYQDVEYYDVYTRQKLELELLQPNSNASLANFTGLRTDRDRHYLYTGFCRRY